VLYCRADATALRTVRRSDDAIIFCVARALKNNSYLNASFEGEGIRLYDEVNVGFPVSVDGAGDPGHPTGRHAHGRADRRGAKAPGGARALAGDHDEEISDGTFTVSNLSMYPVDRFKALISPPQAAILTVGRIRRQPVAVGSDIVVRPTIEFGLTVDHRVADGVAAAVFMKDFVSRLNPSNWRTRSHEKATCASGGERARPRPLAENLRDDEDDSAFEEKVHDLFAGGGVPGFVHLYAGEEAVATGVMAALRNDDYITSTHRGHGHCVAKGVDVKEMLAEIYGCATGCWQRQRGIDAHCGRLQGDARRQRHCRRGPAACGGGGALRQASS